MTKKVLFRILLLTLFSSSTALAGGCDDHCLEKLLAQITTLREELKSTIPVGTILPYAGSQALPQGYALCNGASLNRRAYPKLFEIIGLTFTPNAEHAGTEFRLPHLGGKTLIGIKDAIALGAEVGSETLQLTASNLPPHQHSGTTKSNNKTHTHSGRTGDDSPDHAHAYMRHNMGIIPIYNGVHLNNAGSHHDIASNAHGNFNSGGATARHQHDITTGNESQNHEHSFTTNNGNGLNGSPFSVMQPSLAVRFMIKTE
jgi:microcystin-dependent protein